MIFDVNEQIKLSEYENVLIVPVKSRQAAVQAIAEHEQAKYPLVCEIKQKRPKRSLNMNDYCWVLCTKISEVLSKESPTTKEDVYRRFVRETNCYFPQPIRDDAVERYKQIWGAKGIGWFAEEAYKSHTLSGFTTMHCYYGSSEYDVQEMHNLIQMIVEEAEQLGVETKTPAELDLLEKEWGNA